MQCFNESSASEQPNKAIIQTKIAEYQRNLTYAKRQATRPIQQKPDRG